MNKSVKLIVLCASVWCTNVLAQPVKKIIIPVVKNAQIFATFTDRFPAVVDYFTSVSEKNIISFYKNNYGEPIKQETKRGRLTLFFIKENKNIRVIISKQNSKQQVDIFIEKHVKSKKNTKSKRSLKVKV